MKTAVVIVDGLARRAAISLLADLIRMAEKHIAVYNGRRCPECNGDYAYGDDSLNHEPTCKGARTIADAKAALEYLEGS